MNEYTIRVFTLSMELVKQINLLMTFQLNDQHLYKKATIFINIQCSDNKTLKMISDISIND